MNLAELVTTEQDRAFRLALRLTGDADEAADAVQETCVSLLDAGGLDRAESPRAWFLKAVVHTVRRGQRQAQRRRRREEAWAVERNRTPGSPSDALDARQLHEELNRALEALDERLRLPMELHYREGLTHAEIAGVLEMPRGTVGVRIQRGLERLRRHLKRQGSVAAPAIVLAGLKELAMPAAPPKLAAGLGRILAGSPVSKGTTGTGAGTSSAAAKGGFALKLIAGLVLAGAIAAGVAVISGGGGDAPLPAEKLRETGHKDFEHTTLGGGKFFIEWAAFSGVIEHLDGPGRGGMAHKLAGSSTQGCNHGVDSDQVGNLYFSDMLSGALRALRWRDRRLMTLAGNGHIAPGVPGEKGPARTLRLDQDVRLAAVGDPLEGDGKLYLSSGERVIRLFRNAKEDGAWWYEKVAGGGAKKMMEVGPEGVPAAEATFYDGRVLGTRDGKVGVLSIVGPKGQHALFWMRDGKLMPAYDFAALDKKLGGRFSCQGVDGAGSIIGLAKGEIVALTPDGKTVKHRVKEPWPLPWGVYPDSKRERWFIKTMDDYVITRVRPDGSVATLSDDGSWRKPKGAIKKSKRDQLGGWALNWSFGRPLLDGRYAGWSCIGCPPLFVGTFGKKED